MPKQTSITRKIRPKERSRRLKKSSPRRLWVQNPKPGKAKTGGRGFASDAVLLSRISKRTSWFIARKIVLEKIKNAQDGTRQALL